MIGEPFHLDTFCVVDFDADIFDAGIFARYEFGSDTSLAVGIAFRVSSDFDYFKTFFFKLELAPPAISLVLVVTLFMSRATLFEPIVTVSVPSDLLFKLVVTLAKPIPAISEPVEILSEPLPALFEPVVRLSRLLASGDLSVFVDAIA